MVYAQMYAFWIENKLIFTSMQMYFLFMLWSCYYLMFSSLLYLAIVL